MTTIQNGRGGTGASVVEALGGGRSVRWRRGGHSVVRTGGAVEVTPVWSGWISAMGVTVRGLTRRTLRTLRLRCPPPPLPPYILLHLIIVLLSFHFSYLFSPSDRILRRTLRVPSVGPYHIHIFTLRFIFHYRTISIYIISRTFYSLP